MENASKAIIIAGAVLFAILIISIGMFIYNNAQNTIDKSVASMSAYDKDQFNYMWTKYTGQQSGTIVKQMISQMVVSSKTYKEEASKLPDLYYKARSTDIYEEVTIAPGDGVDLEVLNRARSEIVVRHIYTVEVYLSSKSGLVSGIIVKYDSEDGTPTGDITYNSNWKPDYDLIF